jgi:iron complex outermembrane receptor protein
MGIPLKVSTWGRVRAACSVVCAPILALFAVSIVATPVLARALDLDRVVTFSIEPQPIESALITFSKQAHIQVLISPNANSKAEAPALNATVSARIALDTLLRNTGLTYAATGESVSVTRVSDASRSTSQTAGGSTRSASGEPVMPEQAFDRNDEQGSQISGPNRAGIQNDRESESKTRASPAVETVIVTAQKRTERLVDVPIPVTVVSTDALVANNQPLLRDYYTSVPGLNDAPALRSDQVLSIRGLNIGLGSNPTVGITVDDVPYGASTNVAGGTLVPDIDPGDLARVEVLRGPQGTLYGAGSIGGLIKFLTVDPSTDQVSGRVQTSLSGVQNGEQLGYSVRGAINVPLSDTIAVRASGFTRQDPGYIDNVLTGQRGVNKTDVYGGRLSGLWRPSDSLSLKLNALFQHAKADGASDAGCCQSGLGDLQQSYVRDVGGYERDVQAYSAMLTTRLGGVDVTVLSGYNVISESDSLDLTYAYAQYLPPLFGADASGVPIFYGIRTNKFTQEIRFSAPIGKYFEWLFGAFYTHEDNHYTQDIRAEIPTTAQVLGDWVRSDTPGTYQEYAAFTDLTYHVTDRFDIQIGGRESQLKIKALTGVSSGPLNEVFGSAFSQVTPALEVKNNAFTYLVTPRFKVSSEFMLYARLASGYRAGGANTNAFLGLPPQYKPDKTENYELGIKGDFLDHVVSIDSSVYYIDWKDVQLDLYDPKTFGGYISNTGGARSKGVEFSIESKPLPGLTVAGWITVNDAVLTKAIPPNSSVSGDTGDRLPNSSRYSSHVSLDQEFPLGGAVSGFVGAVVSYVGDRKGEFVAASTPRQDLPSYTRVDLRTGAKYSSWTANLFVNNLANRRGLLSGGTGNFPPGFYYVQPRTVGLSLATTF